MEELMRMVEAQRRLVEDSRERPGIRRSEVAAQERTLRWLTGQWERKSGAAPALHRAPPCAPPAGPPRAVDDPPTDLERAREEASRELAALRAGPLRRITWFVPSLEHLSEELRTVLRLADGLRRRQGLENTFVVHEHARTTPRELEARVLTLVPESPGHFQVLCAQEGLADLPPSDLAIATSWRSARIVRRHPRARARAYLVQDFEPGLFPAGSDFALAEQTYRMGLHGIFSTRGLHEQITSNYPMTGCWFEPAVERHLFHDARPRRARPVRVFFHGRPSRDEHAFELGMGVLRQLKREFGAEVDIVTAGEKWEPATFGLEGTLKNQGALPHELTGDLYRECDVGLSFQLTPRAPWLPLELMACGVTLVTNDHPAHRWLFEHERNCLLSEPLPSSVLAQVRRAVWDAALRSRLGKAAAERVLRTDWEQQVDQVYGMLRGGPGRTGSSEGRSGQPGDVRGGPVTEGA